MLRLPRRILDLEKVRRYCCGEAAARRKGEWVILEFHSEDEGGDWDDSDAQLSALIPLRADLARGDQRCLYLAWLRCVQAGEVEGSAEEPPVPPGLRTLTGPLRAFAEFIRIDRDLIAASAEGSCDEGSIPQGEMKRWIRSLPDSERTRMLLGAAVGGCHPQAELLKGFRDARGPVQGRTVKARTVAQLLKAAQERAEVRRRQAKERAERERARREQEARAARERYLSKLAKRGVEAWTNVDQLITTKQPKKYDEAVALLRDLQELAVRDGKDQEVSAHLRRIWMQHEGKPSFIGRLRKAGLFNPVR
ncbi:MAG: hypothetical protein OER43_10080 [Gammaproteobacteria bacterium]|nr:hypothetical protein [Gammaproteobacteria bacterium]MDH3412502.1 hypothetical protein [Gammaproteobacteria bacterium]